MNNICFKKHLSVGFVLMLLLVSARADIVPPPNNVKSRHDVNVTTGQVQITHRSVEIGGPLGLSHSVSTFNSSWLGSDYVYSGPSDAYAGKVMAVPSWHERYWLVASDGVSSVYFDPGDDPTVAVPNENGVFPPIKGDKRYSLYYDEAEDGLVMLKPDGTKVIYGGSRIYDDLDFAPRYVMTEIRKPNGFTIKVNYRDLGKPASVITNTGFQLRYYFVAPEDRSTDPDGWWGSNPKYVVGYNNAVEYCPHTASEELNADCSSEGWPKVEYQWSENTPMGFRDGPGKFSVINPDGTQTDYLQSPFNRDSSSATRITTIKSNRATETTRRYSYKLFETKNTNCGGANISPAPFVFNTGSMRETFKLTASASRMGMRGSPVALSFNRNTGSCLTYYSSSELGVLQKSWEGDDEINYSPLHSTQIGVFMSADGHQGFESIYINASNDSSGGSPLYIRSWDYNADFYNNGLLETFFDKRSRVGSTYKYDERGNITSVTAQGETLTAEYEDCDLPRATNSNYKYCNRPKWTKDAKGNKTDYTYHQQSGQVSSVSLPADARGVRQVKRFAYGKEDGSQYHAYVKNSVGQKVKVEEGIWLLRAEKTCENSETVGQSPNQSCSGKDELVTTYEYNHDNLLLTGTTVYSQRENKTLRSCFYYDKYGNKIGETQPNANLPSCESR